MLDVLLSAAASFAVSLLLLRRVRIRWVALFTAVAVGVLVGWQALPLFDASQTSLGYLLQTNPDLQIIYNQTHSIVAVAQASRYAQYILLAFNALGALFGYALASYISRKT